MLFKEYANETQEEKLLELESQLEVRFVEFFIVWHLCSTSHPLLTCQFISTCSQENFLMNDRFSLTSINAF
jgi:hypothetical protein